VVRVSQRRAALLALAVDATPTSPLHEHAVVAWHERLGERVARIVVPATGPTTLEISYP
jgi:hypothetical protein